MNSAKLNNLDNETSSGPAPVGEEQIRYGKVVSHTLMIASKHFKEHQPDHTTPLYSVNELCNQLRIVEEFLLNDSGATTKEGR